MVAWITYPPFLMMSLTTASAPGASMSPITTLELMRVSIVCQWASSHGLRHLPILRKGQSHLLANTIRTSYSVSPFLSLASSRNVTRTRQHDNFSFCTFCIRKQLVVRDDSRHDGRLRGESEAGLIRVMVSAYSDTA